MIFKTYIELEVEVEFDGTPEEKPSRHSPGYPAEIEITSVTICQNQSALQPTPHQTVLLETDAWTHLSELRDNRHEP